MSLEQIWSDSIKQPKLVQAERHENLFSMAEEQPSLSKDVQH